MLASGGVPGRYIFPEVGSRKMASSAAKLARSGTAFSKFFQSMSGFNKYGLLLDDCLHGTPEVEEAVRRLPQDIQDVRTYRITRALLLNTNRRILPKEEWTKYEDDIQYLKPYLDEVLKEKAEKEAWNKLP